MPTYSVDSQLYRDRVHRNGREVDHTFDPDEHLFRRYPKRYLVNGKPVPITMQFEADSGISVNRSRYSQPQDVLEPDCCDGESRPECVVLDIHCDEVPKEITTKDGSGRVFRFRLAHKPKELCFAHSEIWCNQQGDIRQACEEPPRHVKDIFRVEIARQLANREVLEFPKEIPR